jgi:hypothetical protein
LSPDDEIVDFVFLLAGRETLMGLQVEQLLPQRALSARFREFAEPRFDAK